MNYSLFDDAFGAPWTEALFPGAVLLRRYALTTAEALISALNLVYQQSPLRQMQTPGGRTIAVHNTSCGDYGWISDAQGYRYTQCDPQTQTAWPPMPGIYKKMAAEAANTAGYIEFNPDSCLINRYLPGTKLSLHQDKDESDFTQPIVSVSLGMSAVFVFGGMQRSDQLSRITLEHGDVLVWGGSARLLFHGVQSVKNQPHPLLGSQRINLTFRRAN